MKFILIISFLLLSSFVFCQNLKGIIIDTTLSIRENPVTIDLIKDSVKMATTITVNDGVFQFKNIMPGTYKLLLHRIGNRTEIKDNIILNSGQNLELNIRYPDSCLYNYPKDYVAKCPENSEDKVIPIIYGFPTDKTMKRAKKGKVHLGGCNITGCDPKYYCTIHKKEF